MNFKVALAGNPNSDKILMLYQAGVLTGSDIYGTFHPDNSIKRSEAAAIIARMAIPSERKNVTLMNKYVWKEDTSVTAAIPQDAVDISSLSGVTAYASKIWPSFSTLSTTVPMRAMIFRSSPQRT